MSSVSGCWFRNSLLLLFLCFKGSSRLLLKILYSYQLLNSRVLISLTLVVAGGRIGVEGGRVARVGRGAVAGGRIGGNRSVGGSGVDRGSIARDRVGRS